MKTYLYCLFLFSPLACAASADNALLQRIEQLERRVEALEQQNTAQQVKVPTTPTPALTSRTKPQPIVVESGTGYASVRYWLGDTPISPENDERPVISGRMRIPETLVFRPDVFGVRSDQHGWFSSYKDASSYPVVSLYVDAHLELPEPGQYQLYIKPTPPREVGGSGNVEMAIQISIDGEQVFNQDYSPTLAPSRVKLVTATGNPRFQLRAIARSPGFGPSPTKAQLYIGLQGEGVVGDEPIAHFLSAPQ